ncbi:ABC1 kinase family protein [Sutcliffiella horikoshii]|uniref:ABC1 kinase family protein n=1 Tax=Sutcliffiella horikoshii TaxID=79883 RepID=UPI001CFE50DA|nr:AarF/UbiB family protein [Sutcliffiella horikoshii]
MIQILNSIWKSRVFQTYQGKEILNGNLLRTQLQTLGPTFIKLGQFLSTRDDLFTDEVLRELEKLQDQGDALPFGEIEHLLESEWKLPISTVLREIFEQPLGNASIGQVYKAVLISGETVAIKVQKSSVEKQIQQDLTLITLLAKKLDNWLSPTILYSDIVREFAVSLQKELDFEQEMVHMQSFARYNKSSNILVPKVYRNLSTKKVLVMEYMQGEKVTHHQFSSQAQKREFANRFASHLFCQIFVDGYFHADPHPGNVLILGNDLIYLDFGNIGKVYGPTRKWMGKLFFHLTNENFEHLAEILAEDMHLDAKTKKKLVYDLSVFSDNYVNSPVKSVKLGEVLFDLIKLMKEYDLYVPSEMMVVGSALLKAERTIALLDPELTLASLIKNTGIEMLKERYQPNSLIKEVKVKEMEWLEALQDIPNHVNKALKNIATGTTPITIDLQSDKLLDRKIDRMVNLITFSIVLLSFSIISTGIILSLKVTNNSIISSDHAATLGVTSSLVVTVVFIGILISLVKKKIK